MKIITKEAKELKEKIKAEIESLNLDMKPYQDKQLGLTMEVHENWFNKNGTVKRKDIANREKFLVDAVFQYLELDDKFIFNHKMVKIQDTEEYSIIKIELKNET